MSLEPIIEAAVDKCINIVDEMEVLSCALKEFRGLTKTQEYADCKNSMCNAQPTAALFMKVTFCIFVYFGYGQETLN